MRLIRYLAVFAVGLCFVASGATAQVGLELSWEAPLVNTDGSPLVDLGGYVTYWGTESRHMVQQQPLTGTAVRYLLDEQSGTIAADTSGVGAPLPLSLEAGVEWVDPQGLIFNVGHGRVMSSSAATHIINAAMVTDDLTVEVWITPANVTQTGPARILTISGDGVDRNVTLGQSGDTIAARLRTTNPAVSGNGTIVGVEFTTPPGTLAPNTLQHVVMTFSQADGMLRLYINGVQQASDARWAGTLDNWDTTFHLGLGNEFIVGRPWLGTIHFAAAYDRAFAPAETMVRFIAGVETGALTRPNTSVSDTGCTPSPYENCAVIPDPTALSYSLDAPHETMTYLTATAFDLSFNESAFAEEVSILTPIAPDTTPPGAATIQLSGMIAGVFAHPVITLTPPGDADLAGYDVCTSEVPIPDDGDGEHMCTSIGLVTTWDGPCASEECYIRIEAHDTAGNFGPFSNELHVATINLHAPVTLLLTITE